MILLKKNKIEKKYFYFLNEYMPFMFNVIDKY